MDPNELIKHAPELLKGGAAVAGALKFTGVIKAMLGPATAEIAERFRDDVRRYRYARQLACLKKAEQMAKDAGFTPNAVPIKLLFPLLEGASLEEDEDLHTMWAALLANAASPKNVERARPAFIAILKHLSHDEAVMLKWMLDQLPTMAWRIPISYTGMEVAYSDLFGELKTVGHKASFAGDPRCRICVSGLAASGLIEKTVDSEADGYGYWFSWYGYEFIEACQSPKHHE
jgi:abortive infection alpha-like protein